MSGAVTRWDDDRLPALLPKEPAMSRALAELVDRFTAPHPDVGTRGFELADHMREEATAIRDRYVSLCQPGDRECIRRFLIGLNKSLKRPLDNAELLLRIPPMAEALTDIPAGVFCSDTRGEARRGFDYFPSAAELHGVLAPYARPWRVKRNALDRVLETKPPEASVPREPYTEDRRAHNAALIQSLAENFRMERAGPMSREPRPRYLTRGQLIAAYREGLNDPSVARLAKAALRRLGDEAPEPARDPAPRPAEENEDLPW